MGHQIDPPWWTHWDFSLSSQYSMTKLTKAMVCTILTGMVHINDPLLLIEKSSSHVVMVLVVTKWLVLVSVSVGMKLRLEIKLKNPINPWNTSICICKWIVFLWSMVISFLHDVHLAILVLGFGFLAFFYLFFSLFFYNPTQTDSMVNYTLLLVCRLWRAHC